MNSLTTRILCGILGYLSLVNPSYAIFNCRTPEDIKGVAIERGYRLVSEKFSTSNDPALRLEFDIGKGRHVLVYFDSPRKDRPELLCMYHEEILNEMGGVRL